MPVFRTGDIELSAIKAMELKASKIPHVVSLAQGIPSFDTPAVIRQKAVEAIESGLVAKYSLSPGLPQLREMVAERLRCEGMYYDHDSEVLITCGAIEGIAASLLAILNPGDQVLLPTPTYASYPQVIKMAGGIPVWFPLDEAKGWAFDLGALKAKLNGRIKAILFSNPNNPTGTVYTREQLLELAKLAEKHDFMIITDEVYRDFIYTSEPFFTLAELPQLKNRVIRVFSFSKAYAMTGWRIGFVHSAAENIREILKIHDALVTCAPVVSQYAAMAAFEYADGNITEFREAYRRRRDLMCGYLDGLSKYFSYSTPNSSYFVFPKLLPTVSAHESSELFCNHLLEEARVALVPGKAFGPAGEGHVRLSFGRTEADITQAFERLGEYLTERRAIPVEAEKKIAAQPRRKLSGIAKGFVTMVLKRQAHVYLWRNKLEVIAVAGTVNKSRTREFMQQILGKQQLVRMNSRSYNTEIGLPLAVLDLPTAKRSWVQWIRILLAAEWRTWVVREKAKVLVLELGVDQPGEMKRLLAVTKPRIAVFTEIKPSYTAGADVLDTISTEFEYLVRSLPATGFAVLNAADRRIEKLEERCAAPVKFYGSPRGLQGLYDAAAGRVIISEEESTVTIPIRLTGDSELKSFLAAAACGRAYGMTLQEIAAAAGA